MTCRTTQLILAALTLTLSHSADDTILDDWYRFPTDCKLTPGGHEYAGTLTKTSGGKQCQAWNSHRPHYNYYVNSRVYPEGNARAAGSYCRNPDYNWDKSIWCYTTDRRYRWQSCDVPFCECKLYENGTDYQGQITVTSSNLTCQLWTNHTHNFTIDDFPETKLRKVKNFCRNPAGSRPLGPWCYTTDPRVEWEYCNVSICNISFWYRPSTTTSTTTISTSTTSTTMATTTTTRRTTTTTRPTTTTTKRTTTPRPTGSVTKSTTARGPPDKDDTIPDRDGKDPNMAASQSGSKPNIGVLVGVPLTLVAALAAAVAVAFFFFRERITALLQRRPEKFVNGMDNLAYNVSNQKVQIPQMNTTESSA